MLLHRQSIVKRWAQVQTAVPIALPKGNTKTHQYKYQSTEQPRPIRCSIRRVRVYLESTLLFKLFYRITCISTERTKHAQQLLHEYFKYSKPSAFRHPLLQNFFKLALANLSLICSFTFSFSLSPLALIYGNVTANESPKRGRWGHLNFKNVTYGNGSGFLGLLRRDTTHLLRVAIPPGNQHQELTCMQPLGIKLVDVQTRLLGSRQRTNSRGKPAVAQDIQRNG